ncbi:condensation domain-containing protein [Streptomyces sp. 8N114]|uniref:condensation domain-containing protein n=1 Tax=Streptomyces sp. 8N114 TaxID=3457419 RepID=UPI003FD2ACE3
MSSTQQRIWFLTQLDGDSAAAAYNLPGATRLAGPLDRRALLRALEGVVQRHEVLRTCFRDHGGVPYQRIEDGTEFTVQEEDLDDPDDLPRVCAQEASTPFALDRAPLIRARLLRLSEQEHVLLINMHHSVSDGWSFGIFQHDLAALYEAFRQGRPSPLPPLPVQYADYARWQRGLLADGAQEQQLRYWVKQLASVPAPVSLPVDRERPEIKTYHGARESFRCPPELLERLRALSARHDSTLYMTLLAAYNVVLHRSSRQTDIAVGTVVANRGRPELEGLIGFFVNTLVMRTDLSGDPTFSELLARVRRTTLDAYDHQEVPFGAVVEALRLERDPSRHSPLFQSMFVLQEARTENVTRLGELELHAAPLDVAVSKFELTVELQEIPDGLTGIAEYNTDLFDPPTIQQLIAHYTAVLASAADAPGERISRLAMQV